MDAPSLRALGRLHLQKLAKENNIKANLKSTIIIKLLLERQRQRTSSPPKQPSPASRKSSKSKERAKQIAKLAAVLHSSLPANNSNSLNTIGNDCAVHDDCDPERNFPSGDAPHSGEHTPENMELEYPSSSTSHRESLGTPESSMANTPEPEAPSDVLEDVVETMSHAHERDKMTLNQISALRAIASKLRGKAEDLRASVRAEKARRQRLEAYVPYWRPVPSGWTYKDIWDSDIRFYTGLENEQAMEINSSEDEMVQNYEENEKKIRRNATSRSTAQDLTSTLPTVAQRVLQRKDEAYQAESFGKKRNMPESQELTDHVEDIRGGHTRSQEPGGDLAPLSEDNARRVGLSTRLTDGGALEIAMQPAPNGTKAMKRRREEEESLDDASRYRPVARLEATSPGGENTPASSPTQRRIRKGKGKMTPAEIEEMLRELGGDSFEVHSEDESPDRRTKQVSSDMALAQLMQREEYSLAPQAPVGGPVIMSPSRPVRRSTRTASKRPA